MTGVNKDSFHHIFSAEKIQFATRCFHFILSHLSQFKSYAHVRQIIIIIKAKIGPNMATIVNARRSFRMKFVFEIDKRTSDLESCGLLSPNLVLFVNKLLQYSVRRTPSFGQ